MGRTFGDQNYFLFSGYEGLILLVIFTRHFLQAIFGQGSLLSCSLPGINLSWYNLNLLTNEDVTPPAHILEQVVERYGYSQREVADHLGMHFTSISRIIRERNGMLTK